PLLIPQRALNLTVTPFLRWMGPVGGFVVVAAALVAITLTPAMLSLLGHRALSKRERRRLTDEVPNSQPKKQLKRMSNTRAVLSTIGAVAVQSEEHTSELQSRFDIVFRLLLQKQNV